MQKGVFLVECSLEWSSVNLLVMCCTHCFRECVRWIKGRGFWWIEASILLLFKHSKHSFPLFSVCDFDSCSQYLTFCTEDNKNRKTMWLSSVYISFSSHLLPDWPQQPSPPPLFRSCPPIRAVVTVQIYLSCSAQPTESSGGPVAPAVTARAAAGPRQTTESSKAGSSRKSGAGRKTPSFNLHLRKSGSLLSYSSLDTPSYRSPVKSPSQYFQICY